MICEFTSVWVAVMFGLLRVGLGGGRLRWWWIAGNGGASWGWWLASVEANIRGDEEENGDFRVFTSWWLVQENGLLGLSGGDGKGYWGKVRRGLGLCSVPATEREKRLLWSKGQRKMRAELGGQERTAMGKKKGEWRLFVFCQKRGGVVAFLGFKGGCCREDGFFRVPSFFFSIFLRF